MDKQNIKKLVCRLTRKYATIDPFELAHFLNIEVFYVPLGSLSGFYRYMKKSRCVFINSDIENDSFVKLVMAHELGHAILHTKENCCFMDNKTFLNTTKIELQANIFASELLISDDFINLHQDYTLSHLRSMTGLNENIISIKLNNYVHSICL